MTNEVIKHTVHTETYEFDPTKYASAEEAYHNYDDHDDKIVGVFDTIDEARSFLADQRVETFRFSYRLAQATVAWIAESVYNVDEDGELEYDCSYDVWDFKYEDTPPTR